MTRTQRVKELKSRIAELEEENKHLQKDLQSVLKLKEEIWWEGYNMSSEIWMMCQYQDFDPKIKEQLRGIREGKRYY